MLVLGGVAGGIALIKKTGTPDADIYSQVETNPQTEAATEEQTNPTAENSSAALTKEEIYNKMLNSVDYYNKASGTFIVYGNMTGSVIEFETDIENSKAYCRETEISITNPDEMASGIDIVEGEFPSGYIPSDRIVYCDGENIHDINESTKQIYSQTEKAVTLEESRNNTEKIMSLYVDAIFSNRRDATNTVYAEPYLFPQVMAVRHLPDFSKWEILRTETYAGRTCTVICNNNTGEVYPDGNSVTMYIDNETGVLLYYRIEDKASNLQGCMITDYIAFDENTEDVREVNLDDYEVIE